MRSEPSTLAKGTRNVTDAEAYESFHARQDEESYRRQLFLLGAAFGNEQVAKKIPKEAFADCVLGDALEALKGRRIAPDSDFACLARELGLCDFDRSMKPLGLLKLVAQHCRADADLNCTLRGAVKSFLRLEWVRNKSAAEKREAISKGQQIAASINQAFGKVGSSEGSEASRLEQHPPSVNEALEAKPDEARQ